MRLTHGWAFPDADEFMAAELAPDGTYQGAFLRAALAHVTDWTIAVDGGAHVGTWARVMAQRFTRVVAFEPSPDTYEALVTNLVRFECPNVEALPCALGRMPGYVSMAPLDPRAEALKNTGARYVAEGGAIPRITIDSLDLPTCGLIKLDIEGAEVDALMGGLDTVRRCRPIIHYENKGFWSRFGYPRHAVASLLEAWDYRMIQAIGTDLIWGPGR